MKLDLKTDFTALPRISAVLGASDRQAMQEPFGHARLAHDERHLRRRVIELAGGDKILIDLPQPVALRSGDLLVFDDGRFAEIIAADEETLEVRGRDAVHLAELAWHIGNRHLAAQIEADRIVILRDHVIKAMLEGLGAAVMEMSEPFQPVRGAYSGDHAHSHDHHNQGNHDAHGRLPGDPHYGHDHG